RRESKMDDTEWGIDRAMHEQGREIDRLRAEVKRLTGERDELAANGAAIVGALEERDMARAERDAALARIRELEARLAAATHPGHVARTIETMLDRVLAGEDPGAVVADYQWEHGRGPDL